jgi:hypothetical protein
MSVSDVLGAQGGSNNHNQENGGRRPNNDARTGSENSNQITLENVTFGRSSEMSRPSYTPKDSNGNNLTLPRHENGRMVNGTSHIPSTMDPHTQIGVKKGRAGEYIQTLEWGSNGRPIQRTDWTNHGRGDHIDPHSHSAIMRDGSWSFR